MPLDFWAPESKKVPCMHAGTVVRTKTSTTLIYVLSIKGTSSSLISCDHYEIKHVRNGYNILVAYLLSDKISSLWFYVKPFLDSELD